MKQTRQSRPFDDGEQIPIYFHEKLTITLIRESILPLCVLKRHDGYWLFNWWNFLTASIIYGQARKYRFRKYLLAEHQSLHSCEAYLLTAMYVIEAVKWFILIMTRPTKLFATFIGRLKYRLSEIWIEQHQYLILKLMAKPALRHRHASASPSHWLAYGDISSINRMKWYFSNSKQVMPASIIIYGDIVTETKHSIKKLLLASI